MNTLSFDSDGNPSTTVPMGTLVHGRHSKGMTVTTNSAPVVMERQAHDQSSTNANDTSPTPSTISTSIQLDSVELTLWTDPKTGVKKPAIYHENIRDQLIAQADSQGQYRIARGRGKARNDVTAFHPDQANWGFKDRADRPDILFQYEKRCHNRSRKAGIWIIQEHIVLDFKGNPIKDYPEIPPTCSSEIEGALLEAIIRSNPAIDNKDFQARMMKEHAINISTISMRRTRFRDIAACLSWTTRAGTETVKSYLDSRLPAVCKATNSTKSFRDLSKREIEAMHNDNVGRWPERTRYVNDSGPSANAEQGKGEKVKRRLKKEKRQIEKANDQGSDQSDASHTNDRPTNSIVEDSTAPDEADSSINTENVSVHFENNATGYNGHQIMLDARVESNVHDSYRSNVLTPRSTDDQATIRSEVSTHNKAANISTSSDGCTLQSTATNPTNDETGSDIDGEFEVDHEYFVTSNHDRAVSEPLDHSQIEQNFESQTFNPEEFEILDRQPQIYDHVLLIYHMLQPTRIQYFAATGASPLDTNLNESYNLQYGFLQAEYQQRWQDAGLRGSAPLLIGVIRVTLDGPIWSEPVNSQINLSLLPRIANVFRTSAMQNEIDTRRNDTNLAFENVSGEDPFRVAQD